MSASENTRVYDFSDWEDNTFPQWVQNFKSGQGIGEYSYKKGGPTSFYGTTDTLISLYILNQLDLTEEEKDQWAATINQFQNPKTGWYNKKYTLHYKEHRTAYAVAALRLIDRKPAHPLTAIHKIAKGSENKWEKWIKHPNWSFIWATSHVISGVPAALAMVDGNGGEWKDFFEWYFEWLNETADPKTGYWRIGLLHKLWKSRITKHELGGAFHMYYVYEYFNRGWKYPAKIVENTLELQHDNGLWDKGVTYCIDLDAIYAITRSCAKTMMWDLEDKEIMVAIQRYLERAEAIFNDRNYFFHSYDNSHRLTGALSAIAECQKFYPHFVKTNKPWVQSLDKACFI